ncbi:MAG: Lrp/AsnC family transcriptional regulator [archaeon]
MDKIDKIILAELGNDCRQPLSNIGRRIRKSPQFVKYHLENLKQSEIKGIPIITDFYRAGYTEVTALIKFDIIDPLSEKVLIDYLFRMTETYKLLYTNGNYDIICSFILKDLSELSKIKEEITKVANVEIKFLVNYQTNISSLNYLSEKYSDKNIELKQQKETMSEPEIKEIVAELHRNPFASLLEISGKINSTYDKVKYAIKKSKLLLGNTIIISERSVQRAIIFFKIKNKSSFGSYCKLDKNIVETNYLVGEYDAYIIVESIENVKQINKKIIYDLRESVSDYTMLDANQFYKYGWFGL